MQAIDNISRSLSQIYKQLSDGGNTTASQTATQQAVAALGQLQGYNDNGRSRQNPVWKNLLNLIQTLLAQLEQNKPKPAPTEYRSMDGSGNNKKNPAWGQAGIQHQRRIPQDSSREPGGSTEQRLPNPREVSNAVAAQNGQNTVNQKGLSDLFWMWGQFLDHDMTLTPTDANEPINIAIPQGDPQLDPNGTGTAAITIDRSAATLDANGQRQQSNKITAFVDGSNVYGSDAAYADSLRTHSGG